MRHARTGVIDRLQGIRESVDAAQYGTLRHVAAPHLVDHVMPKYTKTYR
jgi:hypothetical protein